MEETDEAEINNEKETEMEFQVPHLSSAGKVRAWYGLERSLDYHSHQEGR